MEHTKRLLSLLLSLLLLAALAVPGALAEGTQTVTRQEYAAGDALPEGDLFLGYLEQQTGVYASLAGTAGRDTLSPLNADFYDILRPAVEEMAAGTRTSTEVTIEPEDLKGSYTFTWNGGDVSTHLEETGFDSTKIFHALLADLPFDFYWFDSSGGGMSAVWSYYTMGSEIEISQFTFAFTVAAPYRADPYSDEDDAEYTMRGGLGSLISTVQSNAASIVQGNAGKTDYEKLNAYKDAICALVAYDDDAAASNGQEDKTPWHLMNVFDGDPNTNVVCEGYSKAFKYLCDLSSFSDPKFGCYLVSGLLSTSTDPNPGPHMWNHVTLGGRTYLVDVTNCDGDSVGAPDYLFMREALPSYYIPSTGYQILIERSYRDDTVCYDDVDDAKSAPGTGYYGGSAPFLVLATTPYDPSTGGGGGGGSTTPVPYTVTVHGGGGGGTYYPGDTVRIWADPAPAGKTLSTWMITDGVNAVYDVNANDLTATFDMPEYDVWAAVMYEEPDGDGTRTVCIAVEEDSVSLWMVTDYELNGTLIVSAYDADGHLLSTDTALLVDGAGEAAPDLDGAAYVTAFVVDGSFRPLTAKVTADV